VAGAGRDPPEATELVSYPVPRRHGGVRRESPKLAATRLGRRRPGRQRRRGEPLDDLTQVATLGLIKAVDGFDPTYGAAFTSYAVPTIIGEIRRYFRDKGWQIRVPRWIQEIGLELVDAGEALSQRLGHSPAVQELANYLGATEDQVLEAIDAMHAYRPRRCQRRRTAAATATQTWNSAAASQRSTTGTS
jgi:RNA polymerase sigma-B factor